MIFVFREPMSIFGWISDLRSEFLLVLQLHHTLSDSPKQSTYDHLWVLSKSEWSCICGTSHSFQDKIGSGKPPSIRSGSLVVWNSGVPTSYSLHHWLNVTCWTVTLTVSAATQPPTNSRQPCQTGVQSDEPHDIRIEIRTSKRV